MSAASDGPTGVAIIGCGSVSRHYLRTLRYFGILRVLRCADLDLDRAVQRATSFGLGRPSTVAEALADPAVVVVVNLTPPAAHADVTESALRAGKAVFSEKPLALSSADGQRLLHLAHDLGLPLACAPDTMLGRGIQTARDAVTGGTIGMPVAASAAVLLPGHELWHPDPAYYYQPGAGPLFDMGPYYLSALVQLLGPVSAVSARHRVSERQRVVATGPRVGQSIDVRTPTVVSALLDFAGGSLATMTCSFDAWATAIPPIEVYGTEAAMLVPDPNTFLGPVRVARGPDDGWQEIPLLPGYGIQRGIGVADLVAALREGRPPRASAELALHVLQVMEAIFESAASGTLIPVPEAALRLDPMPASLSAYGWSGIPDQAEDARLAELP